MFFLSVLLFSFVSYAADESGTPSSSSFYIRPVIAAIRVAAATPPPVADNDATAADDNDDYANAYDLTSTASFFIGFQNQQLAYQLFP